MKRARNSTGTTLRIFDVSDPTKPELTHDYPLGANAYSEASSNHKAFTFVAEKGLLMFPLVSYDPTYVTGLEVFHVDADTGFERLGAIDHTGLINHGCDGYDPAFGPCYYYYGEEMRRGLLIDEFVYAVSQGGVTVHALDSLGSSNTSATDAADEASRLPVGSSQSSTTGRQIRARAMATRCFSPPESCAGLWSIR